MTGMSRSDTQARGGSAELVAVLLVIALIPAATDTEDEAATGDVVEGVGEQVGVAVAVGGDDPTRSVTSAMAPRAVQLSRWVPLRSPERGKK